MKRWQLELLNILRGSGFSEFQLAVYKATLKIPCGQTRTYTYLARQIRYPRAVRAVANALAKNPFPLLIPCHRVIRKDGSAGGYSGGKRFKERLLVLEKSLFP